MTAARRQNGVLNTYKVKQLVSARIFFLFFVCDKVFIHFNEISDVTASGVKLSLLVIYMKYLCNMAGRCYVMFLNGRSLSEASYGTVAVSSRQSGLG